MRPPLLPQPPPQLAIPPRRVFGFPPLLPMPIFEFYCPDNHKIYSFLARSSALRDQTPRCPDDPEFRMEKRVSRFAFLRGAKEESADDPFAGMDDAKMEALMNDMEKDMAGFDDNNPDPKQMGRLMRKMTEAMGDKVPPEMREMVRRLESGEDPEKLESEFGDMGGDENGEGADFLTTTVKKIRAGLRQPVRDPKLYEMSEWV
jgi:hypothetical protein